MFCCNRLDPLSCNCLDKLANGVEECNRSPGAWFLVRLLIRLAENNRMGIFKLCRVVA
jgi:hypothetical protein